MDTIVGFVEQFVCMDYQSIIYTLLIVASICILMLYYLRWRDYLLPCSIVLSKQKKGSDSNDCPKLSVVIPASNQVELLAEHLPLILEQDYPDFEVVVVDEASDDGTKELIQQLQLRHKCLRYTFVPSSSTEICRRKLAVTLGVRAARSPWCVITTASAHPVSKHWLMALSKSMAPHCDLVIGYANFDDDRSPYSDRAIYEHLRMQLRCFRSAIGYGAMGGVESNFCVRKQAFLSHKGYADNLQVSFGESHLLIDSMSTPLNVGVAVTPDSIVKEELPPYEVWKNQRCYYREILRNSSKSAHYYLLREGTASLLLYLFLVVFVAYLGLRTVEGLVFQQYTVDNIPADVVMLIMVILYFICPVWMLNRSVKVLGERKYGIRLLGYVLEQPFINFSLKWQRRKIAKEFKTK